jgi:hypothetical protein
MIPPDGPHSSKISGGQADSERRITRLCYFAGSVPLDLNQAITVRWSSSAFYNLRNDPYVNLCKAFRSAVSQAPSRIATGKERVLYAAADPNHTHRALISDFRSWMGCCAEGSGDRLTTGAEPWTVIMTTSSVLTHNVLTFETWLIGHDHVRTGYEVIAQGQVLFYK